MDTPEYTSETQRVVCEAKIKNGYEFIGMAPCRMQGDKLFPHLEHTWVASWNGKKMHSHVAIDENGYDVFLELL